MSKPKGALQEAVKLLSYRPRSVQEITLRLRHKKYPEEEIAEATNKLLDWGYLDDNKFAEDWIQSRFLNKPMGSIRLREELKLKGISTEIINFRLEEAFETVSEFEIALKLAYSKHTNKANWNKTAGFLKMRGFSYSTIISVREALGISREW